MEELGCWLINSGYALNSLDHDCGVLLRAKFALNGCEVVQRHEDYVRSFIERGLDFWIVGRGHSSGSSAVEGFAEGKDL